LCNHGHPCLRRSGKRELDALLICDVAGRLKGIERAALNCIQCVVMVAAVSNESRLARLFCAAKDVDHVALTEKGFLRSVKLDQLDAICLETLQTPVDLLGEHLRIPIRLLKSGRVVALREQIELIA